MVLINEGIYAFYDYELESNSYTLINQLDENIFINPTLNSMVEFCEKFDVEPETEINIIYTENNPVDFIELISFLKEHKIRCIFRILSKFEFNYLEYASDEFVFELIDSNKIEIGLFKLNVINTDGVSKRAIVLIYKEYAFTGLSFSSNNQYDQVFNQKKFKKSLESLNKKIDEMTFICPTYGEPTRLKIINHQRKYNE